MEHTIICYLEAKLPELIKNSITRDLVQAFKETTKEKYVPNTNQTQLTNIYLDKKLEYDVNTSVNSINNESNHVSSISNRMDSKESDTKNIQSTDDIVKGKNDKKEGEEQQNNELKKTKRKIPMTKNKKTSCSTA